MNLNKLILEEYINIINEQQALNEAELPYKISSDLDNRFTVYKNPNSIRAMGDRIRGISTPNYDIYVVNDTTQFKEILHDDIMEYLIRYEGMPSYVMPDGSTNGYYGWVKLEGNKLGLSTTVMYNKNLDEEFFNEYLAQINAEHPYLRFYGK
ncbi:MAG: hypothetical protein ACOC22_00885 [bacterium]